MSSTKIITNLDADNSSRDEIANTCLGIFDALSPLIASMFEADTSTMKDKYTDILKNTLDDVFGPVKEPAETANPDKKDESPSNKIEINDVTDRSKSPTETVKPISVAPGKSKIRLGQEDETDSTAVTKQNKATGKQSIKEILQKRLNAQIDTDVIIKQAVADIKQLLLDDKGKYTPSSGSIPAAISLAYTIDEYNNLSDTVAFRTALQNALSEETGFETVVVSETIRYDEHKADKLNELTFHFIF